MGRGKKTPPEVIYAVMVSWSITDNLSETAAKLNMPVTTVKGIVDKNKGKEEFVKLRNEKKNEFADKATKIIDNAMLLLDRRFSRAIEQEENLDVLIDEIYSTPKEKLSQDEKNRLVQKVRALQLQDVKAITTAVGTLFDKRALAEGKPTVNVQFDVDEDKLDKIAELAGYVRK